MPEYAYVNSGNLIKNNRLKPEMAQMTTSFSTPRLSFSTQDVFNLRNPNLSQVSHSNPFIYNPERKEADQPQEIFNLTEIRPKGILVKQKEDSTSGASEVVPMEDKEERTSLSPLRKELQLTVFVFLCFIFLIVIPLSMIVVGSIYIYSCTVEPMIPIFLVVGGSAFLSFVFLYQKLSSLAKKNESKEDCYAKVLLLLMLVLLGWFTAGCYFVYGSYIPDFENEYSQSYCHRILYLYAFWFLNAIFMAGSIFAFLFFIYLCLGQGGNYKYAEEE